MTGVSIPRLRRVRFKDGRTVTVIRRPPPDTSLVDAFRISAARAVDQTDGTGIQAFAILLWDGRGYCYVDYRVADRSPLVAAQLPQLEKDVLLAETGARWSRE